MLGKRVVSAVILIPIVGVALYLGGWVLTILVASFALLADLEYLQLITRRGLRPAYALSLLLIVLLLADAQWPQAGILGWGLVLVTLLALTIEVLHGNAPGSLDSWALSIAGAVYIGLAISYFIRLRALEQGILWVAIALLGTWFCDTGAYFVGRTWGRHPFFPRISPKKTMEGAIGGLVIGVVVVALLGYLLLDLALGWGVLLGVVLVLAATFGDLAESVIKRQVGVKDSGNLIPGHGGALDRIDSLLFVVVAVYYFALLVR